MLDAWCSSTPSACQGQRRLLNRRCQLEKTRSVITQRPVRQPHGEGRCLPARQLRLALEMHPCSISNSSPLHLQMVQITALPLDVGHEHPVQVHLQCYKAGR